MGHLTIETVQLGVPAEQGDGVHKVRLSPVLPDWAIYWTLVNFSKPLATIISAKLCQIFRQFL